MGKQRWSIRLLTMVGVCLLGLPQAVSALPAGAAPPTVRTVPGVEVKELRTGRSRTYTTDRAGQYQTAVFATDVDYRDASGVMRSIDPTLQSDGRTIRTAATPADARVAVDPLATTLASIDVGSGERVGFRLVDARPGDGKVGGGSVTFADAYRSTDLRLSLQPRAVKELLQLKQADAPTEFTADLVLPKGFVPRLVPDGSVAIDDARGATQAVIPHGWMMDSSLGDGLGTVSSGVTYQLGRSSDGAYRLTTILDRGWLADPARVFPVTVDPSVVQFSGQRDDTYVAFGGTVDNHTGSELWVGTGYVPNRSFVHFGSFRFFDDPTKVISNVQIKLYQTYAHACSDDPDGAGPIQGGLATIELRKVTSGWGEELSPAAYPVTWGQQPAADVNAFTSVTALKGCVHRAGEIDDPSSSPNPGWVIADSAADPDVASLVQGWIADPTSNHGIAIRTTREGGTGGSYGFKKFMSTDGSGGAFNYQMPHVLVTWSAPAGTGQTSLSVFRHGNGHWYAKASSSPAADAVVPWGAPGDVPVPGDYDGDGRRDVGVYRPGDRTWYAYGLSPVNIDAAFGGLGLGASASVVPVPADYDGDHSADVAVFVPATGYWYWRSTRTGQAFAVTPVPTDPRPTDIPVPADYNNSSGNGSPNDIGAEPAVYRPAAGADASTWIVRDRDYTKSNPTDPGYWTRTTVSWGDASAGEIPVPGNYWGGMKADIAVFHPGSAAYWRIRGQFSNLALGTSGDVPQVADIDGDGYDEAVVYSPGTGQWSSRELAAGSPVQAFGAVTPVTAGDEPTLLAAGVYRSFFNPTTTPDPTIPDLNVYGDDTFRQLGTATSTGQSVRTVDINLNSPYGGAAQFPVRTPEGRVLIGNMPFSGGPTGTTLRDMTLGVFDPAGSVANGDAQPTYRNLVLSTTSNSTGGGTSDQQEADVADLCVAGRGRLYGSAYQAATEIVGVSSSPDHDGQTVPGRYPSLVNLSSRDTTAASPLPFGATWRTTDDLYNLAPTPQRRQAYPYDKAYQDLVITKSSGTFTLSVDGQAVASLPFDVTAAGLEQAIEGASVPSPYEVTVAPLTSVSGIARDFAIEFVGTRRGDLPPAVGISSGDGTVTLQQAVHRSNGLPAECEVLPTGDVVITQYGDRFDTLQLIRDYVAHPPATSADALALVDGWGQDPQQRSGRLLVLGRDGSLKGYLQLPNMVDGSKRLNISPREVVVDPSTPSGGPARFVVVYDTTYWKTDPSNPTKYVLPAPASTRFPIQEFKFDPAVTDPSARIVPVSEPLVPPTRTDVQPNLVTRFNHVQFGGDGTLFAASASCTDPDDGGTCFGGDAVFAFPKVGGERAYAATGAVQYVLTDAAGFPAVQQVRYSSSPSLAGLRGARALDVDDRTGDVIVTDWMAQTFTVPWAGGLLGAPSAVVDLGGCALKIRPGYTSCSTVPAVYNMSVNKAVIDPVNRKYLVSYSQVADPNHAADINEARSFLIEVDLRRLIGS